MGILVASAFWLSSCGAAQGPDAAPGQPPAPPADAAPKHLETADTAPDADAAPKEAAPKEAAQAATRELAPPTQAERDALRAAERGHSGPVVRIGRRGAVSLALEGAPVGGRPEGPWTATDGDVPLLEDGEHRTRCVVGVHMLNQADVAKNDELKRSARGRTPVAHAIGIDEVVRWLVWVDHDDLTPVLREDVELRARRRGAAAAPGWDVRVFARAGTPFERGASTDGEQEVRVLAHGATLSGWVDRDSIHRILDHRRDVPPPSDSSASSRLLTGNLLSSPGGQPLLELSLEPVHVLRSERGWARLLVDAGDVTVVGWANTKDFVEPPFGGLGGLGVGMSGVVFEEPGVEADQQPHLVPKGTLLRHPESAAVAGVARLETALARDDRGRLWAPSPWGPIEVAVFPNDGIELDER